MCMNNIKSRHFHCNESWLRTIYYGLSRDFKLCSWKIYSGLRSHMSFSMLISSCEGICVICPYKRCFLFQCIHLYDTFFFLSMSLLSCSLSNYWQVDRWDQGQLENEQQLFASGEKSVKSTMHEVKCGHGWLGRTGCPGDELPVMRLKNSLHVFSSVSLHFYSCVDTCAARCPDRDSTLSKCHGQATAVSAARSNYWPTSCCTTRGPAPLTVP